MSTAEFGGTFLMVFMAILGCSILVGLGILAWICWLLSNWIRALPAEHRRVEPGRVWLLMIPVFSVFWNFRIYPPMADSFASYFRVRDEEEDGGKVMALFYCWANVAILPFSAAQFATNPIFRGEPPVAPEGTALVLQAISTLLGMLALLNWVLLLFKFHGLKQRVLLCEEREAEQREADAGDGTGDAGAPDAGA